MSDRTDEEFVEVEVVPEGAVDAPVNPDEEAFNYHLTEGEKFFLEGQQHFENAQSATFLTRADNEVQVATYKQLVSMHHYNRADFFYRRLND